MRYFTVPAGAIVNGIELTESIVVNPTRVTIGDAQYGPEIFELWSAGELATLGIVETTPPPPDPNAGIDAQILALEATVTNRRLREAALTEAGRVWVHSTDFTAV